MPDIGVFIGGLVVTVMVAAAVALLFYGAANEPTLEEQPVDGEGTEVPEPESGSAYDVSLERARA